MGISISYVTRFGFSFPEEQGMDRRQLKKIDSIAQHYVNKLAMPGCAIMVLKGNDIVYEKGFGKMDYSIDSKSTSLVVIASSFSGSSWLIL